MHNYILFGIVLCLPLFLAAPTEYNPGIVFAVPTELMDSLGQFAIPKALQDLSDLSIPNYNFSKKVGLVDVTGNFSNFRVLEVNLSAEDCAFKFAAPRNARIDATKGQLKLGFDIDLVVNGLKVIGKNLTITWDNLKAYTDISLRRNEDILKIFFDLLFLDFSNIRVDFGTTFVDKVDNYIANILIALFGDVLNIPLAIGLEIYANKEFKKEIIPDIKIPNISLTLDLSIVADPYVQNNNFLIPMNGDFYYNTSSKKYLNPSKMTFNLSSKEPQVYIHQAVFNSLIQNYLNENVYILIKAWQYGVAGFTGLYFNTQTFSDVVPAFKTYNQVYNLDFLLAPGKVNPNNVSIFTSNGGYIMATISADMNFVLDETNFTAGGFNLAGQVYIQVLPLINSLRLYISDYELLSVTQTVPTVDTTAAFTLIDILGQYLFGYINYELGLHIFEPLHFLFMNLSNPEIMFDPSYVGAQFDVAFSYKKMTEEEKILYVAY